MKACIANTSHVTSDRFSWNRSPSSCFFFISHDHLKSKKQTISANFSHCIPWGIQMKEFPFCRQHLYTTNNSVHISFQVKCIHLRNLFIHSFIWLHVLVFFTSKSLQNECHALFEFFSIFCFQVDNSFGGDNKSFCSLWPAVRACVRVWGCGWATAIWNMQSATYIASLVVFYFTVGWTELPCIGSHPSWPLY